MGFACWPLTTPTPVTRRTPTDTPRIALSTAASLCFMATLTTGENGPEGHQFHVGVDAFAYAPIPFSLIDAWLADLRREDDEIVALVRERSAIGEETRLSEVAARFAIDLEALDRIEQPADRGRRGQGDRSQ